MESKGCNIAETKSFDILKVNMGEVNETEDAVIVEYPLTVYLNDVEFVTLLCTPRSLANLVAGYLYSEGIINSKDDLEKLDIDEAAGKAYVFTKEKDQYYYSGDMLFGKKTVTTACGGQKSISYGVIGLLGTNSEKLSCDMEVRAEQISDIAGRFNRESELFIATGGVHSCALCDKRGILLFEEDIGRHNALDKILGKALLDGIGLGDKIIATSGRITAEMVTKVIRARVPVLVSRSAPTDAAVETARKYNLTLIGFARGKRMNVYSNFNNILK